MATALRHYQGRVRTSNAKGIKLDGSDHWLNISKFRPVELPPVGAQVDVAVEDGNWLHSIAVLDPQDAHSEPTRPTAPSSARDAMDLPATSRSRPRWPTARPARPRPLSRSCRWRRSLRRGSRAARGV
jgi:hypothetical protein